MFERRTCQVSHQLMINNFLEFVGLRMELIRVLMGKINLENILRNIETQKMNWLIEMNKVDSNLYSHMDLPLM